MYLSAQLGAYTGQFLSQFYHGVLASLCQLETARVNGEEGAPVEKMPP